LLLSKLSKIIWMKIQNAIVDEVGASTFL